MRRLRLTTTPLFPDVRLKRIPRPGDFPTGRLSDVDCGVHCVRCAMCWAKWWPSVPKAEAFSFQIATDNQEETDKYWNAMVDNGGMEKRLRMVADKWGVSWQITPRTLLEALAIGGTRPSVHSTR